MQELVKSLLIAIVFTLLLGTANKAVADPFAFTTGTPDGQMAMASRPSSPGRLEIEAADDFILNSPTIINHATFTGLLPGVANILNVRVEIYRVFPNDSVNPPSGNVTTRVNSPSDVAFDEREFALSELTFTTTTLNSNFTAANSVLNGINKFPNQTTGGEGPVSGREVVFDVTFTNPFLLPADHYFFVPQVELANGEFYWLSAPRQPPPFTPDLQAWIRNENLQPDWSRVGTDIVGAGTFNASFSLSGDTVPELPTMLLLGTGLFAVVAVVRKRR